MALTDVVLMYPPISLKKRERYLHFPMNIVCLGSYLKQRGVSVKITHNKEFQKKELIKIVKEENPSILGLSCDSYNADSCYHLAKLTKLVNKNCLVILGGIHAKIFHNMILERIPEVDIIVRSEGEQPLFDIVNSLRTQGDLKSVSGISYRVNEKIVVNKDCAVTESQTSFVPLAYDLLDMKQFKSDACAGSLPILTGRGCGFRCKFCSDANGGKAWYHRSASSIVEEVRRCIKDYGVQGYFFLENTFTGDKKRVHELCEQIRKSGLKIRWVCVTHVNCVDKELLINMKAAGCQKIAYGVDSLSEDMLRKMKKGNGVHKAMEVLRLTHHLGFVVEYMIVLGYPGETEDTLLETERNVNELGKDILCRGVVMFDLHPGSPIYDEMREKGFVNDEMLFQKGIPIDFTRYYSGPLLKQQIFNCKCRIDLFFKEQRRNMNPAGFM